MSKWLALYLLPAAGRPAAESTPIERTAELDAPNLSDAVDAASRLTGGDEELVALYALAWCPAAGLGDLVRLELDPAPPPGVGQVVQPEQLGGRRLEDQLEQLRQLERPFGRPQAPVQSAAPIELDPFQLAARAKRQERRQDPAAAIPTSGKVNTPTNKPIDGRERRRLAALEERQRERVDGFAHDPANRKPADQVNQAAAGFTLEADDQLEAEEERPATWIGQYHNPELEGNPSPVLEVNGDTIEDAVKYLEQLAGPIGQVFGLWNLDGRQVWPAPAGKAIDS